jgi:hypothetical protein
VPGERVLSLLTCLPVIRTQHVIVQLLVSAALLLFSRLCPFCRGRPFPTHPSGWTYQVWILMAMVAAMVATVVYTYIGWYLDAVLSQKSKHLLYPFTTKCVQVFASSH